MSKRNYITSFRAKEGTPSALLVENGEITLEKAFEIVLSGNKDERIMIEMFSLILNSFHLDLLTFGKVFFNVNFAIFCLANLENKKFRPFLKHLLEAIALIREIDVRKGNNFFKDKKQYFKFKNNKYSKGLPLTMDGYVYNEAN